MRVPGLAHRPVRFVIVGAWNTFFGWFAYAALYQLTLPLGAHYLAVLVGAHITAVLNAYACHRLFVFGAESGVGRSFFRFTMVYWVTFAASLVLLPALVEGLGLHPVLAQGILVAASAAASYVAHVRWSFRA